MAFDVLAQSFFPNAIGLRLGTVCGWSPVLRDELVFNRMCLEGQSKGVIEVRNASAWRSLLFLDDLASFLVALLERQDRDDLYNQVSFSTSIGDLGRRISEALGCRLDQLPDSETYSFALDTRRARAFWSLRDVGLETRVHEFLRDCEGWCVNLDTARGRFALKVEAALNRLGRKSFWVPRSKFRRRFLHGAADGQYETGRHATAIPVHTCNFDGLVLWLGYSPWTPEFRKRKLQIGSRVPESNRVMSYGFHHLMSGWEMELGRVLLAVSSERLDLSQGAAS